MPLIFPRLFLHKTRGNVTNVGNILCIKFPQVIPILVNKKNVLNLVLDWTAVQPVCLPLWVILWFTMSCSDG